MTTSAVKEHRAKILQQKKKIQEKCSLSKISRYIQ